MKYILNNINLFDQIIFSITLISLVIILIYYFYFFIRINYYRQSNLIFNKPISIIICAKNEYENLKQNLPLLLSQNYLKFEVIVVNDQSSDNSIILLENLAKSHENLIIVNIDDFVRHKEGKKFALTLGIKTAKYEHLLLTDADCYPNSNNWITIMSRGLNKKDIVLGFGGYKRVNGILNKIIRYDTFNVAQQYLSFALRQKTYMGVGRNLAYKKSLFFDNKGFASHMHIPSGDDDLFIQEIVTNNNVSIEIETESHTKSEVSKSWNEWIYQKRRHLSTSPQYKLRFKFLLSIYPFSQLLFIFGIITLLIIQFNIIYISILVGIKLFNSYLINYKSMKRLDSNDLYLLHPFYEILNLLIQSNFVLLNMFRKPKRWSK